jgi:biopolymer transport protein ExbD
VNLQNRVREDPDVNLTPLIDVVFLLLIFFMVSTTFERQATLKIDLPEADSAAASDEMPDMLELVIDREGRMYLNERALVNSQADTIRAAFIEASGQDNTVPLVLRADRDTPHHFVVTVMDVAAKLGFANLSIAAERTDGNGE